MRRRRADGNGTGKACATGSGSTTLLIALALAILGGLYSAPWLPGKGAPVFNSALHLAGGLLQFLMGYSLFLAGVY